MRARVAIRGGELGGRLGPPFSRNAVGSLFESITLSFCIVLFKSCRTTLKLRLIILKQVIYNVKWTFTQKQIPRQNEQI